jgi:hypothetical protein
MGWDGTEVTPQIRSLIEDHHLGSIILTAKNLKCELCLQTHVLLHHSNVVKLLSKQQNLSRNYRPLLRTLVIYNLFSLPSIRRMEESTVFSTKTMYANFPVPWASQLLVEPT